MPPAQGTGKKLYTPLDFTAYLDMRPYLSSSVMHARLASQGLQGRQQGRGALPAVPPQRAQQDADPCMYELYTVVCHRGNLQVHSPQLLLCIHLTSCSHPVASLCSINQTSLCFERAEG